GFFFFSSRRRHTRSKRDWSSDVCSSDLRERGTETASLRLHQAFCRGPVLATVRDSEVPFEPSRARRLQRLEEGRTPSCICETSQMQEGDRKSTRLNSSHVSISYAVFCLKKKKKKNKNN